MRSIEEEIAGICEAGGTACLATLVHSTGSVPMSRRAKLLVRANGTAAGTVGGGCLEGEVWRQALEVMREGRARCFRCSLSEDDVLDGGMVCGGNVEILLQPVGGRVLSEVYREVVALEAAGGRAVLATVVDAGGDADAPAGALLLVRGDGSTLGDLGEGALREAVPAEALQVLDGETPCLRSLHGARVYLEPIAPAPTLCVFGGGHVGAATARIGALIGLRVVVIDDRPQFANRQRFPEADQVIVEDFDGVFQHLSLNESAYVVCVTRGHQHDETVMEQALRTPARYLGMIGSRRKTKVILDRLRAKGFPEDALARIHAPIGLEIHADTPEEIAVSIIAEIIAVRRGPGRA